MLLVFISKERHQFRIHNEKMILIWKWCIVIGNNFCKEFFVYTIISHTHNGCMKKLFKLSSFNIYIKVLNYLLFLKMCTDIITSITLEWYNIKKYYKNTTLLLIKMLLLSEILTLRDQSLHGVTYYLDYSFSLNTKYWVLQKENSAQ